MSNKKNRQQGFFLGRKEKQKKESLTEVYKDSKNCEERLQMEKTQRQSKSKKNKKKWKWRKNGKTRRDKKREQADRG